MNRNEHLQRFAGCVFTYFVYSPTFRLMKIGKTKKPFVTGRWMQYITESPERLTPVVVLASRVDLELLIHEAAEAWRSHGEWFSWPGSLEAVRIALAEQTWEVAQVLDEEMANWVPSLSVVQHSAAV